VILWTRLAPEPLAVGGGMPAEIFVVGWEVATDEAFSKVVASGTADADPALGHSVHVDASGLEPDSWYWYRFKVGSYTSAAGRARTTPAADAKPETLRFASACCQSYTDGYPTAYVHMAKEELDLVVFLGDYIYEDAATGPVRSHGGPEAADLDGYRARYALYKSQPELQAMHQRCPWVYLWDDHEVDDNYAGDLQKADEPEFLARRAAAYQAFYEHMPLRLAPPTGPDYKIYGALQWGDLATFFLLDTRQYRDDQNCEDIPGPGCTDWDKYEGTVLGDDQEAWLQNGLRESGSIWKVLANQIVFSSVNFGGAFVNFDQWDGYPIARQRLLDFIASEALENIVIISGDLHVGGVGDVGEVADDEDSPVLAAENGIVVYAGDRLAGFGQTLLVRHAGGFTTAYAHNQKLLVRLGDPVRRGQRIATVGATGSVLQPQLHFELRAGSSPIDPQLYLDGDRPPTKVGSGLRGEEHGTPFGQPTAIRFRGAAAPAVSLPGFARLGVRSRKDRLRAAG